MHKLEYINPKDLIFIDIETVPQEANFNDLNENMKLFWSEKCRFIQRQEPELTPEDLYERAGIYAEFGKVICISMGIITQNEDEMGIRLKSFYSDDEKNVLENFSQILDKFQPNQKYLVGHNVKEFDIPFLCRRMLVHGLRLPQMLNVGGLKPWEVPYLDTMQYWKFGDYKSFTSLKLLAEIFGIPSPKDDIDGSQVRDVYYKEKDLERIVKYCEKDVLAVAQLFLKFQNKALIKPENCVYI